MVFTSLNYLAFFPLLAVLHWITPAKYRWITLLIASYFFYINIKPIFALLVAGISVSTYVFTRKIDSTPIESEKRKYLVINIILILFPLFFFKYFSSINDGIISILESYQFRWPLPEMKFLLPIGISFYTFMAIGYTVDVYNEDIEAEKNIGIVALFLSFFPLILSGPIERAKNMFPQFKTLNKINFKQVVEGMKLMLWGYFMKLVVADRVGIYVDTIYNNIPHHNGTTLLFTSLLYPFQVYADLGGYSLIAIGTAKILGINVMQNFNRPFFATSMSEFWRRWHISLISWLTDYVYTPISFATRKFRIWGVVIALMITFFISGLWHGAALTFLMWGVLQGVFLSIEALSNKRRAALESRFKLNKRKWYIVLSIVITFILFASSQIFGRAINLDDAFAIFYKIVFTSGYLFIGTPATLIYISIGLLMILFKDFTDEFAPSKFLLFDNRNVCIRVISYSVTIIIILLFGVFDGGQFIYFQF
jgi:D-alanyl-lipoteichoic acid acyltransferase DltB (MBOAT superfamily)